MSMYCPANGKQDFQPTDSSSFYRMLSHADFILISLDYMLPIRSLIVWKMPCWSIRVHQWKDYVHFWKFPPEVLQKKLNMFLRWMIRKESEVDFGIWGSFDCRDLLIPLDTHVCRVAYLLGLTDTETFSLKNARNITAALADGLSGGSIVWVISHCSVAE